MANENRLIDVINAFFGCDAAYFDVNPFDLATHLIANGVTLDNQVSSSKWIPVTERLPEPETEVLVLAKRTIYSVVKKETGHALHRDYWYLRGRNKEYRGQQQVVGNRWF